MSKKKGEKEEAAKGIGDLPWMPIAVVSLVGNILLVIALLVTGAGAGAEEAKEVDLLIDEYFRVWNVQDMSGYRDCFHPAAVIYFIDGSGVPRPSGRDPFVESQRQAHAASRIAMREIPLEKHTEVDGNVAHSLVRWKLMNEGGTELGTDYFTYLKTKNGWKIISLVFRKDG